LHQGRAAQLAAAFGNAAGVFRLVRFRDPRHDAEVRRQFALIL